MHISRELLVILFIDLFGSSVILRVVECLQVFLQRFLADEATSAVADGATQKFNAAVCLTHVSSKVVLGRVVLVAGLLPASVAFTLVGRQVNEAVTFEVAGAFERLVAALHVASKFALTRLKSAIGRAVATTRVV